MVNRIFGLSEQQLVRRFYAMRPAAGELSEKFVIRLDHEIRVLALDGDAALEIFATHFTGEFAHEVIRLRRDRLVHHCDVSWREVVALARGMIEHPSPGPGGLQTTPGPTASQT